MARNFAAKAVHKYMYPATYNFRDEADDTSGTDIDFVDSATVGVNTTAKIIPILDGHRKVLELYDNDAGAAVAVYDDFDNQTSGTIEFWVYITDANQFTQFSLYDGGTRRIYIWIAADSFLYNDGAPQDPGITADDNTWYHMKVIFDCVTDTFDWIITSVVGGELYHGVGLGFASNSVNINRFRLTTGTAQSVYYAYYDAIGYSWDTDYAIGDNMFWRHYFDQDSDFESEDVGTTGTSIGFVDTDASTHSEIIAEFNEHKKIWSFYDDDGTSNIIHNFDAAHDAGIMELYWKTNDVANMNFRIQLRDVGDICYYFRFVGSEIQDSGGTGLITTVNNTWYHLKIQWYADDTIDLWVDNILILDGDPLDIGMTTGMTRTLWYCYSNDNTKIVYVDAVSFNWTTGNTVADNRIFDYNDAYTREDITTATQNVVYSNVLHGWRTATLYSKTDYDHDIIFLQIYDINSILALEAEIINRVQKSEIRTYTLLDKNYDDLASLSSNTFSADDLHDPTDSTSMLKTVLPNVSEIDGDLILVSADTKTDTYSTVTKNYPDGDFLRDISDLSDSCVIIEANGKCHLDDDLASGDSLDFDNAADHSKMTGEPKVNDILDTINYFEIFGAINPDTGERFYKITDNSGDDRKRKWRITNNSFRNQTDLDAYAAKLVAKLVSVKEITIKVQGLGAHNMGTLFTYKYDNDIYTIPTAAYYVIYESIDFDTAASTILLSEGIIETSKYAAGFERPQNYSDTDQGQIYDTDIITVYPESYPYGGATKGDGPYITASAVGDGITLYFPIPAQVDDSRNAFFHFYWQRGDANNDTVSCLLYASSIKTDASEAITNNVEDGTGIALAASVAGARYQTYVYTLAAAKFASGDYVSFHIDIREIRTLYLMQPAVVFYLKRSV